MHEALAVFWQVAGLLGALCEACVNGSSEGGVLITQVPFVCSPPGLAGPEN